jgi:hypothetical protein
MNDETTVSIKLNKNEFLDILELLQDILGNQNINPLTNKNNAGTITKSQALLSKVRSSFFGINDSE